tara:strand:+ start:260 stop:490 length:231 start_codon:yes stop_codon:yes gene_type:complete
MAIKKILFSVYKGIEDYDLNCSYYGPAITTSFEEDGQIYVTNGEYISRVNYCPYTGKEADDTFSIEIVKEHKYAQV